MAESSRPARLWYQSFVHPVEQAPYIERLQALLDAAAGPGIRFEVHGLDPPDHLFHPLTEFRCAAQTIRNALEAERAGYDAFVIGHSRSPVFWKSAARSTSPWSVSVKRRCSRH
jgi:hypothetical protein